MEDEGSVLLDGKALGNLRVVDLKQELEKRGLSKSGSKKDLVKRLKQQLEFEKLCGERKTTGDCDLKLELDADTEQNEFVQQYLAQKQKIYAEQKEVKRLIELEEIQKSGDERGSDSPRAEDASDHDTQDTSDGESQPEILQATSSIQEKEDKIDVDSSQVNKDKKQELIERGGIDCKKDLSPNILENIEQNTGANKVSALSESGVEKGTTEVSKIVMKETKDSSYQIKQVENISSFDKKIKDKEENRILKNEQDSKTEDGLGPRYKNKTKSSIKSPANLETEPKSIVSDILGSSDMQCETKDESKVSKELVSERTAVPISEAVETEPRKQVSSPSDSSNEPVLENSSVSEQPSSELISSMTPSFSSKTDKPSEKSRDMVMDPATEASPKIEPQPPVKYVSTRKIRISGRKLSEKSEEEPKVKRGKWGNFSSSQKSQAINISTDSLKNWFPDFKLLKNPDVINEAIEEMQVVSKEENSEHQIEKIDESKNTSQNIDMKDEQAPVPVAQIDESEATTILFIQNLVRPFTLLQLKELLKETGHFIEEKFWIDKIKSKCFVTYSTVEEAIKTKTALNGTRWPSSNPKILSVEYSTEEELELHQSGSEPPKSLPPPPIVENPEPLEEHSLEDARRKDREHLERRRERSKPQPVREWDKNKLTQESPNRERVGRSIERSRSSDKKEKKDTKRRPNEDTPAKLLDDLFQKTKSSPCIYWLPLTEEQVVEREEARRLRRLEREKRNQLREQEVAEQKAKAEQSRNRTREMERRRSSTRSRSPVSRRR